VSLRGKKRFLSNLKFSKKIEGGKFFSRFIAVFVTRITEFRFALFQNLKTDVKNASL
jgi:hypothetical protein